MDDYDRKHPKGKEAIDEFTEASQLRKSKHIRKKSPYTVTFWMQIRGCSQRAYQRMWGDKSTLAATYASNLIMSLVIGSVFYNTTDTTNGFFSKVLENTSCTDNRLVSCSLAFSLMHSRRWEKLVTCTVNDLSSYLKSNNSAENSKNISLRLSIFPPPTPWLHS